MRWGLFGGIGVAIAAAAAALMLSPLQSQDRQSPPVPYQPHRGGTIPIGMNLSAVSYWTKQAAFIDRFKTSGTWTVAGQRDTPVALDADGYPRALPMGAPKVGIQFAVDPPGGPVDSYVLTYRGEGTIRLGRGAIDHDSPGRISFKALGDDGAVTLNILSMNPNDPIRDIHVVRSDQLDLFAKGEMFNPAFLKMVSHFSVLRFMDWGNTNQRGGVDWAARSKPSLSSWAKPLDGIPIEAMVRLANEAHADMWYNVRMESDDAYVRGAMTYIRDNLAPGLRVHVEYGNEVWNWGFHAAHYADEQAKKMWGANCQPGQPMEKCSPNDGHGRMAYYGYRAAQVQAIARQVFGAQADKRLIGVMGAFQRNPDLSNQTLDGVRLANVGRVSQLFGEYAITTYFGIHVDKMAPETVLGWAGSGPKGLDAAFHEMEYGGALDLDLSIAKMASLAAQHAKLAKANGMRMVAYEGSVSLVPKQAPPEDLAAISEFYDRIVADPRMGDLYDAMVTAFATAGGTSINHFNDIGPNGKFGYWGAAPTLYDLATPRFTALVRIADRARAARRP